MVIYIPSSYLYTCISNSTTARRIHLDLYMIRLPFAVSHNVENERFLAKINVNMLPRATHSNHRINVIHFWFHRRVKGQVFEGKIQEFAVASEVYVTLLK